MKAISLLTLVLWCMTSALIPVARAEDPAPAADVKAKAAVCMNNARQLSIATFQYCADKEDAYPASLDDLKTYLGGSLEKFTCPFDPKKAGCGYEFLLAGKTVSKIEEPTKTPMIRAKFTSPDGRRTVVFADGHVERVKDEPAAK